MARKLTGLLNPFGEGTTLVYETLKRAVTITEANTTKTEDSFNGADFVGRRCAGRLRVNGTEA